MKGLILIPDISGFTNFVRNMKGDLGASVVSNLLNEIIDSNPLSLELSEIEGDAILFYKTGVPLPLKNVFAGLKKMYEASATRFLCLKTLYGIKENLSLKFIVHYGEISIYDIKGFKKLYGQTVIESHNLLKNGHGTSDYTLVTEDYFTALNQTSTDVVLSNWVHTSKSSQLFTDTRKINYHFFTYFSDCASERFCACDCTGESLVSKNFYLYRN